MLQMFTVYDTAVEAYMTPFFMRSKGEAIRSFEAACKDPEHNFAKNPTDFVLFYLGEYDDETGQITQDNPPISLGTALEHQGRERANGSSNFKRVGSSQEESNA